MKTHTIYWHLHHLGAATARRGLTLDDAPRYNMKSWYRAWRIGFEAELEKIERRGNGKANKTI